MFHLKLTVQLLKIMTSSAHGEQKEKLLLIDDEENMLHMLSAYLRKRRGV
jgi:hypothetical protein